MNAVIMIIFIGLLMAMLLVISVKNPLPIGRGIIFREVTNFDLRRKTASDVTSAIKTGRHVSKRDLAVIGRNFHKSIPDISVGSEKTRPPVSPVISSGYVQIETFRSFTRWAQVTGLSHSKKSVWVSYNNPYGRKKFRCRPVGDVRYSKG